MSEVEIGIDSGLAVPSVAAAPLPRDDRLRKLWAHRSSRAGMLLLACYALLMLIGPFVVRNNPSANVNFQDLSHILKPSSSQHWLGTDEFGRDELVRLVLGARFTIFIGVTSVLAGLLIGVPLGAISGFFRGWPDLLIQRLVDILLAFPSFLLALGLVAALGPGMRNLILAVALTSFPRFVRLLRASVLSVRELPFVDAARALGVSPFRILWRHVLPNAVTPVVVQTPLELGSAILTAAGLGFLGLGVQQPTPEWGSMLGSARDLMIGHASLTTYPGIAIVGAILSFNLLGDGLRDVLDPRVRAPLRTARRRRARS